MKNLKIYFLLFVLVMMVTPINKSFASTNSKVEFFGQILSLKRSVNELTTNSFDANSTREMEESAALNKVYKMEVGDWILLGVAIFSALLMLTFFYKMAKWIMLHPE